MFADLKNADLQPSAVNMDIPEIRLSLQMRKRLQELFEAEEKAARINSTTSIVQVDNNYVFFANQWYYMAVLCHKFAIALYPYCVFFDDEIRKNKSMIPDLKEGKLDTPLFDALFDNTEDKQRMIEFTKGGNNNDTFRPGKNLFNKSDGKVTLRSCKDVFGSCILKKLEVPDSSSNYLGTLVYYLAQRPELFSDLEAEINEIVQNANNEDETVIVNEIDDRQYTIDELSVILNDMYYNPKETGKTVVPHMFAIKYGKHLIHYKAPDFSLLLSRANIDFESLSAELRKGIKIYRSLDANEYGLRFQKDDDISQSAEENVQLEIKPSVSGGFNKIYYGAPGCGKSHYVSNLLAEKKVEDKHIVRVTFHPEYSNVDFTGQILPTVKTDPDGKNEVEYKFNPGPFTNALLKAYNEPAEMVYLVIEEINRGNAAAIFGDMFQLLDRERDSSNPYWCASEYPVSNPNMQDYLKEKAAFEAIRQRLCNGIYIPGNLTILATMNSSDQNVFTLDTAFKRRWDFEQISNDIEKDDTHSYKKWYVPGTDLTWERFLTIINTEILKNKIHSQTNEDKRLGKYFVTTECLTEIPCSDYTPDVEVQSKAKKFAYKVLEYIWNDVCKIGREEWFDTDKYLTLEQLIDAFVNPNAGANPLSVFKYLTF